MRPCSAILLVIAAGCGSESVAPPGSLRFEDVSSRLTFVNNDEEGDGLHGAAWFDYDDDGHLDLFLTNGKGSSDALYRNNGDGTFTDVALQAGVSGGLGHSGVVAGDLDNDGDQDLFLTGDGGALGGDPVLLAGTNRLYRNDGDGTFTDWTEQSGLGYRGVVASASLGDIDDDGLLDLFVTGAPHISDDMESRTTNPNHLYRNQGDLLFIDITEASGLSTSIGGAWIGMFSDHDLDGRPDLFIGNDALGQGRIELFHNEGEGIFVEVGEQAGLTARGAWMGLTFADRDNDGDEDLFGGTVGAPYQRHALFDNRGDGTYVDVAATVGLAAWEFIWGASFADFDADGDSDLAIAGSLLGVGSSNPTRIFLNDDGLFTDATASSGLKDLRDYFTSGLAQADFDNDGFPEFLVVTSTIPGAIGRPFLYRNLGTGNHSITLRVRGTTSNRDAVGARVAVTAGGRTQVKWRYAGSSFLSMDSPWLTFGLGTATQVEAIEVTWPTGLVERFVDLPVDQTSTIIEGEGSPAP